MSVKLALTTALQDNSLHITNLGWEQALCAGRELKKIIRDEPTRWYVSPYVRTRETFHAMGEAWGGDTSKHHPLLDTWFSREGTFQHSSQHEAYQL